MEDEVKEVVETEEKPKNKRKISKSCIVLCVNVLACGIVGSVAGWFVGSYFKKGPDAQGSFEKDLTSFNNMTEYLTSENKTVDDFSSIDFSSSSVTSKISVGDIVGYSMYSFAYIENTCSYVGFNKAVSTAVGVQNIQDVVSEYYKKDGYMTKENVCKSSTGFVSYGERTFNYDSTKKVSSGTKIYNGSKYDYYRDKSNVVFDETNKTCKATYDKKVKSLSNPEKYINMLSCIPEFPFGYTINCNSIETNEVLETKDYKGNDMVFDNSIKLVDNKYIVNLNLNSVATAGLIQYMYTSTRDQAQLASMKKAPTYNSLGCQVTLSKDLKILSIKAVENYMVYSNLADAATTGYNYITFSYEEKAIPELNESVINYGIAEANI